jgi:hypothetical protein
MERLLLIKLLQIIFIVHGWLLIKILHKAIIKDGKFRYVNFPHYTI